MSVRASTVLLLSVLACSSKTADPVTPLDYVAQCAPGRRYSKCVDALAREHAREETITATGHSGTFPANDLVDMSVLVAHLADGPPPFSPNTSSTVAFRHAMEFRDGYGTVRARVLDLLRHELGPPTNTGIPPVPDPMVHAGDFWIVEDGTWILSELSVLWYSKPVSHGSDPTDSYVRSAPKSAAIWMKLGRLLVTY